MEKKRQEGVMIPLVVGGMHAGGQGFDYANVPDGKSPLVIGFVRKGGRWQTQTMTTNAGIGGSVLNLGLWHDQTNDVSRIVAFQQNGADIDIRLQDAAADTFGSAITGITSATSVADSTNYRGRLFISTPTAIFAFTGTAVTANALGGETLAADTMATFIDRIFLGRVRVSVPNLLTLAQSYDPTSGWTMKNATAENITNGSTIVGRVTPTSVDNARFQATTGPTVAASTTDTSYRFLCGLRNTHASYDMPVTIEVIYGSGWQALVAETVGHVRVQSSLITPDQSLFFRFRCTVGGTTGATEPAWSTTTGATTTDGTVTWVCDGSDVLGSVETTILNRTEAPNVTYTNVLATIPANPVATSIKCRIRFGNSDSPVITLAALEIGYRDGLADGTLGKVNFGQQLTKGRFGYDFYNQQTTQTATITHDDRIYWTETSNPNDLRGSNYYPVQELPGKITAIRVLGGRLLVFKARGMWVFAGTADPDNPLRLEKFLADYGCRSPLTFATFVDTAYFSDANEVYSYSIGGVPKKLCGDAMLESIMLGLGIPGSAFNVKTLDVDRTRAVLIVAINQGSFELTLDGHGDWSITLLINNAARAILFSPATAHMYAADNGPLYYDGNSSGITDASLGVSFSAQTKYRTVRAPAGYEFNIKALYFRYVRGSGWGTSTLQFQYSYRVSNTAVTKTFTVTAPASPSNNAAAEIKIPVAQRGDDFALYVTFTPTSVSNSFAFSSAELEVDVVPANAIAAPVTVSGTLL